MRGGGGNGGTGEDPALSMLHGNRKFARELHKEEGIDIVGGRGFPGLGFRGLDRDNLSQESHFNLQNCKCKTATSKRGIILHNGKDLWGQFF